MTSATFPETFHNNQRNESTLISIYEDGQSPSNYYYNNIGQVYNPELSLRLDGTYQPKTRSYSYSSNDTNASDVALLENGHASMGEIRRVTSNESFAVILYDRYRHICLYLRHILLAVSIVLLTFSLGIFLYDLVTAVEVVENSQNSVHEEIFIQSKASLPDVSPKLGSAVLTSFVIPEPTTVNEESPVGKKREVRSAKDLKSLNKCQRMVIKDLVEDRPSLGVLEANLDKKDQQSVHAMEVKGAVTEEWLEFLLNNFIEVSDLLLDVKGLCVGSKVADRNSLGPLKLQKVQTLTVEKAYLCPLMNWVMRWDMPNIKTIDIREADLSKLQFDPLVKFIETNQNTLSYVRISKSTICSECIFPSSLQSKIRIEITEPVQPLDGDDYEEYDI